MFKELLGHLPERKQKLLSDPKSWHQQFYGHITSQIDETVFSELYSSDNGRPNAPVRQLLGMMLLKEGHGWSDEQLYEQCRFNLQVMLALGLNQIDDDVPVESTYYEFRRRLSEHHQQTGQDLIGKCFSQVTAHQLSYHNLSGKQIRMDSKLLQSNIRRSSRLELILKTLQLHIKEVAVWDKQLDWSADEEHLLSKIKSQHPSQVTYPLTPEQKQVLLETLGGMIERILKYHPGDGLLEQLWLEHYKVKQSEDNQDRGQSGPPSGASPRNAKEVPSSSIQSPEDPQAAYRSKGQGRDRQQVTGYHTNITETCDPDNAFNLITHVQTAPANVGEQEFFRDAVEQAGQLLGQAGQDQKVDHVSTDGAYDSHENMDYVAGQESLHWNMQHHKGRQLRYKMDIDQLGQLRVWCTQTQDFCQIKPTKRSKEHDYVVISKNGYRRYFRVQDIKRNLRLQAHYRRQRPEDKNIRANVESTIHNMFHRLLNRQKTKYRGLFNNHTYVQCRAFWVNLKRITRYEQEKLLFYLNMLLSALYNQEMNNRSQIKFLPLHAPTNLYEQ
jgi:hypothetical protein